MTPESMQAELANEGVPDLSDLIAQLGHERFAIRDAATEKIRLLGPGAIPQLRKAIDAPDPESPIAVSA